jgi:hypothetical protein
VFYLIGLIIDYLHYEVCSARELGLGLMKGVLGLGLIKGVLGLGCVLCVLWGFGFRVDSWVFVLWILFCEGVRFGWYLSVVILLQQQEDTTTTTSTTTSTGLMKMVLGIGLIKGVFGLGCVLWMFY